MEQTLHHGRVRGSGVVIKTMADDLESRWAGISARQLHRKASALGELRRRMQVHPRLAQATVAQTVRSLPTRVTCAQGFGAAPADKATPGAAESVVEVDMIEEMSFLSFDAISFLLFGHPSETLKNDNDPLFTVKIQPLNPKPNPDPESRRHGRCSMMRGPSPPHRSPFRMS
jgi:hypothetical protein